MPATVTKRKSTARRLYGVVYFSLQERMAFSAHLQRVSHGLTLPPPEPFMSICFLWYAKLTGVVFYSILIVITYNETMHFPFCLLREVHLALFSVTIRYVISIPKWYVFICLFFILCKLFYYTCILLYYNNCRISFTVFSVSPVILTISFTR